MKGVEPIVGYGGNPSLHDDVRPEPLPHLPPEGAAGPEPLAPVPRDVADAPAAQTLTNRDAAPAPLPVTAGPDRVLPDTAAPPSTERDEPPLPVGAEPIDRVGPTGPEFVAPLRDGTSPEPPRVEPINRALPDTVAPPAGDRAGPDSPLPAAAPVPAGADGPSAVAAREGEETRPEAPAPIGRDAYAGPTLPEPLPQQSRSEPEGPEPLAHTDRPGAGAPGATTPDARDGAAPAEGPAPFPDRDRAPAVEPVPSADRAGAEHPGAVDWPAPDGVTGADDLRYEAPAYAESRELPPVTHYDGPLRHSTVWFS